MKMDESVLSGTEKIMLALRRLYSSHGFSQYKMGKFEEYDLYSRNKEFLVSDSVITFTDGSGKLLALKPDVTLSIIKNNRDKSGAVQKLFYNENVYRMAKGSRSFKEIMQMGLECIGEVDSCCIGEVLSLAAESLSRVSGEFVLGLSHLGILSGIVEKMTEQRAVRTELIKCVGEKNLHGIEQICERNGIPDALSEPLKELINLYGEPERVLSRLKEAGDPELLSHIEELETAVSVFRGSEWRKNIRMDFSIVGDMNYYNGVIFKGFVPGIPGSVLSGGQYDKLMSKLKRSSRAIGFAVYLDSFDRIGEKISDYDVDVMLVYEENASPLQVRQAQEAWISRGESVYACRKADPAIHYKQLAQLKNGEVILLEDRA